MFEAAHSQESDSSDIGYLDKKPKRRYFDFNVEKSDDNNLNKCAQHNFSIPELFSLKIPHSNESKFIPPLSFNNFLLFNFIHFFLSFTSSIKSIEDLKFENKQITILLEHLPMIVYMKDKNRNFITGSKHSRQFVNEGVDPYAGNIKLEMSIAEESIKLDDYLATLTHDLKNPLQAQLSSLKLFES